MVEAPATAAPATLNEECIARVAGGFIRHQDAQMKQKIQGETNKYQMALFGNPINDFNECSYVNFFSFLVSRQRFFG